MSDLLGDALARWDDNHPARPMTTFYYSQVVAAARKWHTLTNPETVERIAKAIQPWIAVDPATEHEWPLAQLYNARVAAAVAVDALTDTT